MLPVAKKELLLNQARVVASFAIIGFTREAFRFSEASVSVSRGKGGLTASAGRVSASTDKPERTIDKMRHYNGFVRINTSEIPGNKDSPGHLIVYLKCYPRAKLVLPKRSTECPLESIYRSIFNSVLFKPLKAESMR